MPGVGAPRFIGDRVPLARSGELGPAVLPASHRDGLL